MTPYIADNKVQFWYDDQLNVVKPKSSNGLLVFLMVILLVGGCVEMAPNQTRAAKEIIASKPTMENIALMLLQGGVKIEHLNIILNQVRLETANLTSNVFRCANNLFGMRIPHTRRSLRAGEYNGYSAYFCWEDSVLDYIIWYKSQADFLSAIRRYAETPDYYSVVVR